MADLGNLALILALALAGYGTVASLIASLTAKERFRRAAVRSFIATSVLVLFAVIALGVLIHQDNFNIVYVQRNSNKDLADIFKFTAIWGGSQGSLLWWTLILCAYTTAMLALTRKLPRLMMSWAMVFVGMALVFFLVINNIVANPFNSWHQVVGPDTTIPFLPADGTGLNPQLQHWAMIIHPPLLYIGYIGFLFPFAMAMGALITRMEGREWIRMIRRWTLVAWLILGVGIVLGGAWAYMELGWGGYWAWDPVENASFMPWLLATAFIHSVMAQEKRGMLKLWNVMLIATTYLMCIFGTFLTRSGMISSVHAFAKSDIGYYFIAYLVSQILFCAVVLIARRDQFTSDNRFDSFVSREVGLLFNNVLFVTICLTVLLGTTYPMITEFLKGQPEEIRHYYFKNVDTPLFLLMVLLMAIGPILTWKRTSKRLIRERFLWPAITSLPVLGFGLWFTKTNLVTPYVGIYMALGWFLMWTVVQEFWEAARARAGRSRESLPIAFLSLMRMNKRRYGGYFAHLAILLIGIGFAGSSFNRQAKEELGVGGIMEVGPHVFQVQSIDETDTPNYAGLRAQVNLIRDGQVVQTFFPEQRFYKASRAQASEVAIDSTLARDYYVVLSGRSQDSLREHPIGVFHIYVNPLVLWIWIGGILMVIGTVISLLPDMRRVSKRVPSTQPLGEPA